MVGHEMYSFMDGYSGYSQVKMSKEDKEKMTFISKWGAYEYNVNMPFGLCNVPSTFQKVVTKTFKKYLKFMQVFLDDFSLYSDKNDHLDQLQKCLEECKRNGISHNPKKCALCVNSGVILGHIVCGDGLLVNPQKIIAIITMQVPINVT